LNACPCQRSWIMDHQEELDCPYLEKESSEKQTSTTKRNKATVEEDPDAQPTKRAKTEVPSGSGGEGAPPGYWVRIGKRYGDGTFLVQLAPGLKYEIDACRPHVTVGPNVTLREGDYFDLTDLSCRFGRKWYVAWTVRNLCDENKNPVRDQLGFPCHVTVSYGRYLSDQQLAKLC
jgi:hypothetical protein